MLLCVSLRKFTRDVAMFHIARIFVFVLHVQLLELSTLIILRQMKFDSVNLKLVIVKICIINFENKTSPNEKMNLYLLRCM